MEGWLCHQAPSYSQPPNEQGQSGGLRVAKEIVFREDDPHNPGPLRVYLYSKNRPVAVQAVQNGRPLQPVALTDTRPTEIDVAASRVLARDAAHRALAQGLKPAAGPPAGAVTGLPEFAPPPKSKPRGKTPVFHTQIRANTARSRSRRAAAENPTPAQAPTTPRSARHPHPADSTSPKSSPRPALSPLSDPDGDTPGKKRAKRRSKVETEAPLEATEYGSNLPALSARSIYAREASSNIAFPPFELPVASHQSFMSPKPPPELPAVVRRSTATQKAFADLELGAEQVAGRAKNFALPTGQADTDITLQQVQRMKVAFDEIDNDGDGEITMKDINANSESNGGVARTLAGVTFDVPMFRRLDKDRSGTVDFVEVLRSWYPNVPTRRIRQAAQMYDEFLIRKSEGYVSYSDQPGRRPEQVKEMEDLFRLFDSAGRGWITTHELLQQLGPGIITRQEVASILRGHWISRGRAEEDEALRGDADDSASGPPGSSDQIDFEAFSELFNLAVGTSMRPPRENLKS